MTVFLSDLKTAIDNAELSHGLVVKRFRVGREVWDMLAHCATTDPDAVRELNFMGIPVLLDRNIPADTFVEEYA